MPINGIGAAYKDRYTFAPLSQRAAPIQWYTLPLRFIRPDDWSGLPPVAVDPKPKTGGPSGDDLDNAGIRREPTLPEHEAIAPEAPQPADPFAILVDDADDEPIQENMLRQRMRTVARQVALDPGDGLKL